MIKVLKKLELEHKGQKVDVLIRHIEFEGAKKSMAEFLFVFNNKPYGEFAEIIDANDDLIKETVLLLEYKVKEVLSKL
ncbi:MAG: hypothetical protein U9R08_02970 [Nanoarchaeota archaeon]|nr:hypothetical protein [Nanoarchaeota archaeon]